MEEFEKHAARAFFASAWADGPDWEFYETMASEGTCPSSFYRDDTGRIFWDMTH